MAIDKTEPGATVYHAAHGRGVVQESLRLSANVKFKRLTVTVYHGFLYTYPIVPSSAELDGLND